jgi:hypothetical protein
MTYEGVQYERQSKNNSTCQRLLYSAAIVSAGKAVLLVRKISVLLVSGSLNLTRRRCSGYFLAE